jgi:hypothetical protein
MRSLVSYDDITLPYQPDTTSPSNLRSSKPPPAKKSKRFHPKSNNKQPAPAKTTANHDKTLHPTAVASAALVQAGEKGTQIEIESRELTHGEIWDDSALIEAWNAATEEYEAFNGPDKGWKSEPVHKSPL